jgi:CrcB protein
VTAPELIAVGLIGGAGAVGRVVLAGSVTRRVGGDFPFGTLAVNVSGALLLGLLVGASLGNEATRLLGTGLCGGYTTFSTWALESHRLAEGGERGRAALNFAVSLGLGLGAVWLGRRLGSAVR